MRVRAATGGIRPWVTLAGHPAVRVAGCVNVPRSR